MHECCLDYLTQQLPSWFYISFTSLDSRYIIRQIIILIVSRSCMFSQDYDLVLHWVSCVTYITSLQGSYLIVLCLNLALKTLILILNNLYLIVTILQITFNKDKCCILFFHDLLVFLLQLSYLVIKTTENDVFQYSFSQLFSFRCSC